MECVRIAKWISDTTFRPVDIIVKHVTKIQTDLRGKYLVYIQELCEFERILQSHPRFGRIFYDSRKTKEDELTLTEYNRKLIQAHFYERLGKRYSKFGYEVKNNNLKY